MKLILVINHSLLLMMCRNPQRWEMILQERSLCSLNKVMSPLLKSVGADPRGCFDLCCLYWKLIASGVSSHPSLTFRLDPWGKQALIKGLVGSCSCAGRHWRDQTFPKLCNLRINCISKYHSSSYKIL